MKQVIETGVDKLVELIKRKEKTSLSDAAKELSVPMVVIEEWANFLEEKGIVEVKYIFTKPYLLRKEATKEDVDKKKKEFESHKEGFIRKTETTLNVIEKETEGLRSIKDSFSGLGKDVEEEVKKIKTDLEKLEKFETIKKDIDDEIIKQQDGFKKRMDEINFNIIQEKEEYAKLIHGIEKEEKKVNEELTKTSSMKKNHDGLILKFNRMKDAVLQLQADMKNEDETVKAEQNYLNSLKDKAEQLRKDFEKKKSKIDSMLQQSQESENNILNLQKNILEKIGAEKGSIKKGVSKTKELRKNFQIFFDKKVKIDVLLDKVNSDVIGIEKELAMLIDEASVIDFHSKSKTVKDHISHLEKKFNFIKDKKNVFETEIGELKDLLK